MKKLNNFRLIAGLLLSLMLVISSCDEDDDNNVDLPADEVEFKDITLSGAAEVQDPAVVTDGSGEIDAVYDKDTNILTYSIRWELGDENDETVGMHLHGPATKTENAGVVIGIPLSATGGGGYNEEGSSSGSVSGSTRALTQAEEDQLLNGLWYLNIHSTTYPDGELRGQIE